MSMTDQEALDLIDPEGAKARGMEALKAQVENIQKNRMTGGQSPDTGSTLKNFLLEAVNKVGMLPGLGRMPRPSPNGPRPLPPGSIMSGPQHPLGPIPKGPPSSNAGFPLEPLPPSITGGIGPGVGFEGHMHYGGKPNPGSAYDISSGLGNNVNRAPDIFNKIRNSGVEVPANANERPRPTPIIDAANAKPSLDDIMGQLSKPKPNMKRFNTDEMIKELYKRGDLHSKGQDGYENITGGSLKGEPGVQTAPEIFNKIRNSGTEAPANTNPTKQQQEIERLIQSAKDRLERNAEFKEIHGVEKEHFDRILKEVEEYEGFKDHLRMSKHEATSPAEKARYEALISQHIKQNEKRVTKLQESLPDHVQDLLDNTIQARHERRIGDKTLQAWKDMFKEKETPKLTPAEEEAAKFYGAVDKQQDKQHLKSILKILDKKPPEDK